MPSSPEETNDPRKTLRAGGTDFGSRGTDTQQVLRADLVGTASGEHVSVVFNLINGEERAAQGNDTFDNVNPASPSQVLAQFPRSHPEDAVRAIEAAARAAPGWAATNIHRRAELLNKLAFQVESQSRQLSRAITLETGKTLAESQQEVLASAVILRHAAALILQPEGGVYRSTSAHRLALTRRHPLGVVAAITSFDFPLALPCWKLGPALLAGNACVFKPSEKSPNAGALLGMLGQHVGFPRGVLNVLHGPGEPLAETLCTHRSVGAVTFAGSPLGARKVGMLCGRVGKKCQVESAGKNAVLVLDDADVRLAVHVTLEGAFRMAGQKCNATSRVIVTEKAYERFAAELAARLPRVVIGDPSDPATYMGPLIDDAAVQRVLAAEREALDRGARHLVPPDEVPMALRQGHFLTPRVLVDPPHDSRAAVDELFGPLVCLSRVRDVDEAVALANATPYGLSSSIITRNMKAAMSVADRLEVGVVRINGSTTGLEPHVPIASTGESGVNSISFGHEALEFFSRLQTLYLDYS